MFGKELCNKLSVFVTGSDARQEANPQLKKYEMIIVYLPETNLEKLQQKLDKLCENFSEYLDTDIELRSLENRSSFGHYKDTNNNQLVFPTRCLDAHYLTGKEEVDLAYKSKFLEQLRQNQFSLAEFKKKRYKDTRKQLKKLLADPDYLNAAKIKYSVVRAIQYYVALEILTKFKSDNSLTVADLKNAGTTVEARLNYLKKTELTQLYRQCLTTSHFYAVAQDRSLDVAKTNESLIDVAQQISDFLDNN